MFMSRICSWTLNNQRNIKSGLLENCLAMTPTIRGGEKRKREKMSDNIVLEKITFYKVDDDGNPLLNSKGVERVFTLKDDVDCSWICEATDEKH